MLGHGESEDIAAAAAHEGVDEARQHPLRLRGDRVTSRVRAAQHYHKTVRHRNGGNKGDMYVWQKKNSLF